MIKKKFIHQLPDQPYKQTASKNLTVECEYYGPQFLLLRINEQTKSVVCVERYSDEKEPLEASIVDDGPVWDFVVLDAAEHTWEAAYVTGAYTHGTVPDYEETLPTGEKYTFVYPDGAGIVGTCHAIEGLKYDKNLKMYTRPGFVAHPLNSVSFWESVDQQKLEFEKVLAGDLSKYSNDVIVDIRNYHEFLSTVKTRYQGVDHWKIGWPKFPNLA